MSNTTTTIEAAYIKAADALGITLDYSKELTATFKRRDAAAELMSMKPRDPAQELAVAPNTRQWESILDACAAHNARTTQAQAAIRGGLLSRSTALLDRELTAHVPTYVDQTHDTVAGLLATLTEHATNCETLNAQIAVTHGYGDHLTQLHQCAVIIRAHANVGIETSPTIKTTRAARSLAMIVDPGEINVIRRTEATRWGGGELRSSDTDIARREIARGLISNWLSNPTDTLRKLARNEYPGHTLSAATVDDYAHRVTQYENAEKIIRISE